MYNSSSGSSDEEAVDAENLEDTVPGDLARTLEEQNGQPASSEGFADTVPIQVPEPAKIHCESSQQRGTELIVESPMARYEQPLGASQRDLRVEHLHGSWETDNGIAKVGPGGRVTRSNGGRAKIVVLAGSTHTVTLVDLFTGQKVTGQLFDNRILQWSAGDTWTREGAVGTIHEQQGAVGDAYGQDEFAESELFNPMPRAASPAVAMSRRPSARSPQQTAPRSGYGAKPPSAARPPLPTPRCDRLRQWQEIQQAWGSSAWLREGGADKHRSSGRVLQQRHTSNASAPSGPLWGWQCVLCRTMNSKQRPACKSQDCGAERPPRRAPRQSSSERGTPDPAGQHPRPARPPSAPPAPRVQAAPAAARASTRPRSASSRRLGSSVSDFGQGSPAANLANPPSLYW